MRRTLAVAVLLVSVAVAGTFAYQARAQQAPVRRPEGSERILIVEPAQQAPQQAAAAPAAAPMPVQPAGPVHVVTFVDITPLNRDPGTANCKQYAADTRRDPGVVSVELLAQTNRPNHLVIYEVWQNQAAYERHEALQHTKDFRAKMLPIIGSPFDQRPHYVVP
ncbi:MAG TPA: antibiotic biosynthesis monooxygenase [Candidatus Acidoferrales bacterium]